MSRRSLIAYLFDGQPAAFASDFDLAESVRRLRAATVRPSIGQPLYAAAEGHVDARHVSLTRAAPGQRNSFKPHFHGAFRERDGRVVLEGRFGLHGFTLAFFAFCGLFFSLATVAVVNALAMHLAAAWWAPVALGGMAALVWAVARTGRDMGAPDQVWLSRLIGAALTRPPGTDPLLAPPP